MTLNPIDLSDRSLNSVLKQIKIDLYTEYLVKVDDRWYVGEFIEPHREENRNNAFSWEIQLESYSIQLAYREPENMVGEHIQELYEIVDPEKKKKLAKEMLNEYDYR